MKKADIKNIDLPDQPGVYFFLGPKQEILYIGKATSLKNRVYSYFASDIAEKRSELIKKMVAQAKTVDVSTTESVLEALILETNLIRTHKPAYNTRSKDDKSYNYLIITKEEWPRVLIVREKELTENFTKKDVMYSFGPFPSSGLFREAFKIIRKLFKFFDTSEPVDKQKSKLAKGRIDFNRQIDLYPQPEKKEEYKKTIHQLKLFFQGKKKTVIKELENEMNNLAKKEEFEKANQVKKKIFALKHINDIGLIKRANEKQNGNKIIIEAYDVAHYRGKQMVGAMTVVENGEVNKSKYRLFKINSLDDANDPKALTELLQRRLNHTEWEMPQIIVVDGNNIQKKVAEAVLKEKQLSIPVVAVVKDEHHRADRIISDKNLTGNLKMDAMLANAEAHRFAINYHRKLSRQRNLS